MSSEHPRNRWGNSYASGYSRAHYGTHYGNSNTTQVFNINYGPYRDDDRQPEHLSSRPLSEDLPSRVPSEPVQAATYKNADLSNDSIRIMRMHLKRTENIQVAFEDVRREALGRRSQYTALLMPPQQSECLGPSLEVFSMTSTEQGNSIQWNKPPLGTLLASSYLHAVLQQLVSTEADRDYISLWVEELCTGATDFAETYGPLKNGSIIFESAETVQIWLGPGNQEIAIAVEFLQYCSSFIRAEDAMMPGDLKSCGCILKMLQMPVFNNRRLVQRMAFARATSLHFQHRSVHWRKFCHSVHFLQAHLSSLQKAARILPNLPALGPDSGDLESLAAVDLVHGLEHLRGRGVIPVDNAEWLLHEFESLSIYRENSNGRGKCNALTPLRPLIGTQTLRRRNNFEAQVPKSFRIHAECIEFVVGAVDTRGDVDIFCRPWVFPPNDGDDPNRSQPFQYPSWMQSIEHAPYGMPESHIRQRLNGDSFVRAPGKSPCSASQGKKGTALFGNGRRYATSLPQSFSLPSGSALARSAEPAGYSEKDLKDKNAVIEWAELNVGEIGPVMWTSDPVADGVVPAQAMERIMSCRSSDSLARQFWHTFITGRDGEDTLWRTLIGDRDEHGDPAPPEFRTAFVECTKKKTGNGHFNTINMLAKETSELVRRYLERVQRTVWNRRFFQVCTHDKRILQGLGPAALSVGDTIAILRGCSVPVALLRHGGFREYILVGETYVHGIMNGEAVEVPVGLFWKPAMTSLNTPLMIY